MKLNELNNLLLRNKDKTFHLVLPNGESVPSSFHVTEVGYVTKRFIDCGGKLHTTQSCLLQTWLGSDTDHRLSTDKLAHILDLAQTKGVLPGEGNLDVEIEYENVLVSQYAIASGEAEVDTIRLTLAPKHTDCLAKDQCRTSLPMASSNLEAACCGAGSGCC